MDDIRELQRLASPAPQPQSLAWDGTVLWMCSRETLQVYALDPATLSIRWQTTAPGAPYGMTALPGELRVTCSETEQDHRIIRRCIPYHGFDEKFALQTPDDTGSQLGFDGRRLHVCQWYLQRVLALDGTGRVERVIPLSHQVCGQVFVDEFLYVVTTDDEATTDYWLTRVDLRSPTPKSEDLARIPFAARSLAFDGTRFWTNHRDKDQIVSFARVD